MEFLSIRKLLVILEKGELSFYCAILAMIILPVRVDYLPPVMILWAVVRILEWFYANKNYAESDRPYILLLISFCAFYVWQALGFFYSLDKHMALLNLFGRLSIVVFPLVLVNPGRSVRSKVFTLMKIFAISTVAYLLFCFAFALFRSLNYIDGKWIFNPVNPEFFYQNYFFSADLTVKQHPSYVAMYVILSAIICLESSFSLNKAKRILWILPGAFLVGSLYFISSRASIIICLIILPVYLMFKLIQTGKFKIALILFFLTLISGGYTFFKFTRNATGNFNSVLFSEQASNKTGRDPRTIIWKSAMKIAGDNLVIGVGLGDARNELTKEYIRIGKKEMVNERLNAHNQFLEILLESGFTGLFLFLVIFILMFNISFKDRNLVYGTFIILVFMFFIFESVLYRFAGVSFFALFSCLLIHYRPLK